MTPTTYLGYWHVPLARFFLALLLYRIAQNLGPTNTLAIEQVCRNGTVWYCVIVGVLVRAFLVHCDSGPAWNVVTHKHVQGCCVDERSLGGEHQ